MTVPVPGVLSVIVLAAGEGTRMRSPALPKVLHGFAGRSMLHHVLAACDPLGAGRTVVVVGHRRAEVSAHLEQLGARLGGAIRPVVQDRQLGTGHAVRLALAEMPPDPMPGDPRPAAPMPGGPQSGHRAAEVVLVVPGDAPLLTASALTALLDEHRSTAAAATLLTSVVDDPAGYGRVIRSPSGGVERVVEHKDANPQELAVREIATSVYAFDGALLRATITEVANDNAAGEYYLPDVISLLVAVGRRVSAVSASPDQTAGVNDRVQLANAHRVYNDRLLHAHMLAGVTVVDPASTWVDADVQIDVDVTVLPGVELQGRTALATGARVGPQTTLRDTVVGERSIVTRTVADGARIGSDVTIGPFAYLRPGTALGDQVHLGTYVEVKNSSVGVGSKVPHLTYVGDADIGEHTNIGAATVFVNYDGVAKHRSVIGDHVRSGADNMFVAPVQVGDGAYTAAGSVITQDVPPGSMAVARATQRNVQGWVARKRAGTPAADAAARALRDDADTVEATGAEPGADATDAAEPGAVGNPEA